MLEKILTIKHMFKKQFIKTFEKLIEENCLYIPDAKWNYYSFEFQWYKIYIKIYLSSWDIYEWTVEKDWKILIDSNFEWTSIFETIKDKIESNFDKAMENEFEKFAEELEWKSWWEMSQEFKDARRLREIANEAQQIHSKYSKKFFWLF